MEVLDTEWVSDFEDKEKSYNDFYQSRVQSLQIYKLYVKSDCILDKVKEYNYKLHIPNCLTKKELIEMIQNKKHDDGLDYKLLSILKYNVDLKPEEVKKYILDEKKYGFIDNIRELQDIYFYDTITIFKGLNSIFFIYYELNKKIKQNKTKKIYIKSHNSKHLRTTKRKPLKDTISN